MYYFLILISLVFLFSCESQPEKEVIEKKETKVIYKKENVVKTLQERISNVIQKATPSIVTILSKSTEKETPIIFKFNEDIPSIENESLGSGFVIKKNSQFLYIVTNNHVIEKAKTITVRFHNGYKTKSIIAGKDAESDIAVLKVQIDPKIADIKPLEIGDPSKLRVGYFVLSAGSPYNVGLTFTLGIVSALHRNLGISAYENYIQTDAAINPGDSGGPLLDLDCKVVGMNTAIIQAGQGLGFALPIDMVMDIANQLIAYGKVQRGWIGVITEKLSNYQKKKLHLNYGVKVIKVFKDSPAYKAGIKAGDIILSVNGKKIRTSAELKNIVLRGKIGETLNIVVFRHGKKLNFNLKIEKLVD